jgi:hypothetical protein
MSLVFIVYFYNKPSSYTENNELVDDSSSRVLIQDKNLHQAFEQVLKEQSLPKRTPSSQTSSDAHDFTTINNTQAEQTSSQYMSDAFVENFKNEMSDEERKEAIENLKNEIASDQEILNGVHDQEQNETIKTFEERLNQKENQLKYLSTFVE